ncbi:hypothetical protein BaRGS_00023288, partial [Batillaria attramentaria]
MLIELEHLDARLNVMYVAKPLRIYYTSADEQGPELRWPTEVALGKLIPADYMEENQKQQTNENTFEWNALDFLLIFSRPFHTRWTGCGKKNLCIWCLPRLSPESPEAELNRSRDTNEWRLIAVIWMFYLCGDAEKF